MNTLLTIENHHAAQPPRIEVEGRYLGVFQNKYGEQAIILIDRTTGEGELLHGDTGWKRYPIKKDKLFPDILLSAGERLWVLSCWAEAMRMTNDEIRNRIQNL